jgi:VanZ family protein
VCVGVACIILSLGLTPFRVPENQVSWPRQGDGILFGVCGTVLGEGQVSVFDPRGGSIELWALPTRWSDSATILAVYQPKTRSVFKLRQSLTDLEVEYETDNGGMRPSLYRLTAKDAFGPALHRHEVELIAVTYGTRGLNIYVNAGLSASDPSFKIDGGFSGRLIVGDAPRQPDSFRGKIHTVAIAASELSAQDVSADFRRWPDHGSPADREYAALYLFNEGQGRVIHDRSGRAGNLLIPEKYTVVDKIALEPFWREFDLTDEYWRGNLKNIIGFVPVGFIFYVYFRMARRVSKPLLYTIMVGTLLSVTIEVGQVFLPTRDSGTTDIITNTFGTWLGVVLFQAAYKLIASTTRKSAAQANNVLPS